MNETITTSEMVVRTSRGLTVVGTRITLYSIMDCVKADWPPKLIRDLFDLTDEQMAGVLAYIEAHEDEVEAEYQMVLQQAEKNQQYWTEFNREHLEKVAAMPYYPERAEIWQKLKDRQAKLETS